MSSESQYRWFQVTYQLGVFISRSSSNYVTIPTQYLKSLAVLQVFSFCPKNWIKIFWFQIFNAGFFTITAIYSFLPHILIAFLVILFEGLLGGASYVNTFRAVHKEVFLETFVFWKLDSKLQIPADSREFSMGVVSISDTIGIVFAGFLAMPVHNRICSMPMWYNYF